MRERTLLAEQTYELTEDEAHEFFQTLDEFRANLTDKEELLLATMVVAAADPAEAEASLEKPLDERVVPSEEEQQGFAAKLDQLHDSLPGSQHLYLDALIGTAHRGDVDVEAYGWLWKDWIPASKVQQYRRMCQTQGGGHLYVFPPGKSKWRFVGCWSRGGGY